MELRNNINDDDEKSRNMTIDDLFDYMRNCKGEFHITVELEEIEVHT